MENRRKQISNRAPRSACQDQTVRMYMPIFLYALYNIKAMSQTPGYCSKGSNGLVVNYILGFQPGNPGVLLADGQYRVVLPLCKEVHILTYPDPENRMFYRVISIFSFSHNVFESFLAQSRKKS